MTWTFGLDLLILVLLTVAIAAAVVLNRTLRQAKRDWQSLEALTGHFRAATEQAGDSIRSLKLSTAELGREVARADTLCEELKFLIERGGALADRLEEGVRCARAAGGPPLPTAAKAVSSPAPKPKAAAVPPAPLDQGLAPATAPRSQAERALLEALRAQPS